MLSTGGSILTTFDIKALIAQLIGFAGMVTLFIMYRQSSRKRYLFLKLASDMIWAVHYFLLGAVGGAIPNLVGIFREIVFLRPFRSRKSKIAWASFFIAVNAALAISLAESLIQFMPICASALVTVSLTFRNTANIRLLTIPICLTFLVYDLIVGSWSGALNETLSLISMVSKSVIEHRSRKT